MGEVTLEGEYFRWLYDQVYETWDPDSPESYTVLCYRMSQVEFKPLVPNDGNRADDAVQLREDFRTNPSSSVPVWDGSVLSYFTDSEWRDLMTSPVNLFEMLVGLARRAEFFVGKKTIGEWFAEFIGNLGLGCYTDEAYELQDDAKINRVLDNFNDRRYDAYGRGGIFPLREPEEDQRTVELWYQLSAYAGENRMY